MRALLLSLAVVVVLPGCSMLGRDGPEPPRVASDARQVTAEVQWRAPAGRQPADPSYGLVPAVAGEQVIVAGADGEVLAYAVQDGKRRWRTDLNAPIAGGPGVGAGLVVVGTREGQVIGLDAATGAERWRGSVTSEVLAAPAVGADIVVVRTADGRAFGLDSSSGERRWFFDRAMPALTLRGQSAPVLVGERLALLGLDGGQLVVLDLATGKQLAEVPIASPSGRTDLERMVDIDGPLAVFGDSVYVTAYKGRVVALDIGSGRASWQRELSSSAGLSADAERVYVTDTQNRVWALDRFSGATVWRQDALNGLQLTAPAAHDGYVVVGDADGYLSWLDAGDGSLLRRQSLGDAIVAAPLASGGRLYVLSDEGLRVIR